MDNKIVDIKKIIEMRIYYASKKSKHNTRKY